MRVLLAIDGSPSSERLIEEAVARPWPAHTQFCVLNVVYVSRFAELPALLEDARRQGEGIVEAGAVKLARVGRLVETRVVSGPPRRVISGFAEEWGADFIVVGSHGHGAVGRFLLGSVTQGVLRKAHCSVEIVRTRAEAPVPSLRAMKILVSCDGSECSLAASQSVANRPWPTDTEFQILSVEELVSVNTPITASSLSAIYPASLLEERLADARARAMEALTATKIILTQAGLKILVPKTIPTGDPRTIILDTAEAWGADLIVLGSHGRSGLDRILMGSVSEAVAVHAHCSVEVIRKAAVNEEG